MTCRDLLAARARELKSFFKARFGPRYKERVGALLNMHSPPAWLKVAHPRPKLTASMEAGERLALSLGWVPSVLPLRVYLLSELEVSNPNLYQTSRNTNSEAIQHMDAAQADQHTDASDCGGGI